MILKKLKLQNFGVFSGTNIIELEPRVRYGKKRPIVLFGGLNGAGKTTTLTAIRLVLYGRQSIGKSTSIANYHEYLKSCIHRPKFGASASLSSSIELEFSYGRQGENSEYKVTRAWSYKNKKLEENIEVFDEAGTVNGLMKEQKQAFLNELIPRGIADLFFFDGEKISELAEDDGNVALGDAINRLLGLDIIDRLGADLSIYLRDQKKEKLPSDIAQDIELLESKFERSYKIYQNKQDEINNLIIKIKDLERSASKLRDGINDLGGAWAKSRQEEEKKFDDLKRDRDLIITMIKEIISGVSILGVAKKSINSLLNQLLVESKIKNTKLLSKELKKRSGYLKKELKKCLGGKHSQVVAKTIDLSMKVENPLGKIIHDISDTELSNFQYQIRKELHKKQENLKDLSSQLDHIERNIELVGVNISRAPDQKRIAALLDELSCIEKSIGESEAIISSTKLEAKKELNLAIDILRKLRDREKEYGSNIGSNQAVALADSSRSLLIKFSEMTKKNRIALLEYEFLKSFSKLTRKEDMNLTAKIKLDNYAVKIFDQYGNEVVKDKLSAGEKQIYAIAMLEALGRASGRNLPIIIDTPLGRLDSNHRNKLVKNYFPTASHQVLVLSTDTEIDEDFYRELSPDISHAYSVDYCSKTGSSQYNEGYFWRQKN